MTGRPAAGVRDDAPTPANAPRAAVAPLASPETPDERGVTELAAGFGVALVALIAFALIAGHLYDQEAIALDNVVTPVVHSIQSPVVDAAMEAITSLGSATVLTIVSMITVVVLASRRRAAHALFILTAIAGSVALNGTLKVTVQRPRPVLPWAHVLPDYSFPSGHTMNALVLYLAIALVIWVIRGRRLGSIAVLVTLGIAIAVGVSRIYLGYHYLSDVVGGLAAGIAWLLVVALAYEAIPRAWGRRRRRTGGTRLPT
jgi:undecaprenyl-diphosphatase